MTWRRRKPRWFASSGRRRREFTWCRFGCSLSRGTCRIAWLIEGSRHPVKAERRECSNVSVHLSQILVICFDDFH